MKLGEVKWVAALRGWWKRPQSRAFRQQVLVPYVVHRTLLTAVLSLTTGVFGVVRIVRADPTNPVLDAWLRRDSLHYLQVAVEAYGPLATERRNGFFPLYPGLVSLADLVLPLPWAALLVSNVCAILALEVIRRLALHYGDADFAKRVVWIVLLFPSSYVLTAGYSESTYLLFTVGAVLAWHNEDWRWAFVCAAFAALARPVGALAVTVPFVIGALIRRGRWKPTAGLCFGAAFGLCALGLIYNHYTRDPLAFYHARGVQNLRVFWHEEVTPPPVLALLADEGFGRNLMLRLLNWSSVLLALVCSIALFVRRRWELALLCVVSLGIPLYFHFSLVDLASMSRYILAAFPLFLVLASWFPEGKAYSRLYDLGSQMFQVALLAVFGTGQWLE